MIWIMRIVAILLILVGLVWIGQGGDLIKGSVMTGSLFWLIAGIVCLVVGAFLGYRSLVTSNKTN